VSDACTASTDQFSVGGRVKGPFRPTWDSDTCPSVRGLDKDRYALIQISLSGALHEVANASNRIWLQH